MPGLKGLIKAPDQYDATAMQSVLDMLVDNLAPKYIPEVQNKPDESWGKNGETAIHAGTMYVKINGVWTPK